MWFPLFAVRTTWLVILFVLVIILVLWFVGRVAGDLFTWFREEIVEDVRDRRRKGKQARAIRSHDETK
jgi:uncharacterized membrane protein SpoIIM required for sporulation